MRIAVDAVGGDRGPQEILAGLGPGLEFLGPEDKLLAYGPEETIKPALDELGLSDTRIEIVHCSQTIEMHESPVEAVRGKRDSSIYRMARDAGKGEVDSLISAGNTGAFVAACQLKIKTIAGVGRPGIAVLIPTFHGPVIVCDVGANVAPKPRHLYEYARMSTIYCQKLLQKQEPRVGLISIGEEESKGNQLVRESREMIKADPMLHFVGNIEGRDIFDGVADVCVCDGFVGNVVLKLTEGLAEGVFRTIKEELKEEDPEIAQQFEPTIQRIWKRHDFAEYGGAPLLGLNHMALICHGRSDARAITSAIRVAAEQLRLGVVDTLNEKMQQVAEEAT